MARPTVITNAEIIKAARELFFTKGFGASTADIARRACISEGSIFKRFATKERLFTAAMGLHDEVEELVDFLDGLSGEGAPRARLVDLCQRLLDTFLELMPGYFMAWSNGFRAADVGPHREPARVLGAITGYFERERAQGRLGDADPVTLARIIHGTLFFYVVFKVCVPGPALPEPSRYMAAVVDILWSGVAPRGEERPPHSPRSAASPGRRRRF